MLVPFLRSAPQTPQSLVGFRPGLCFDNASTPFTSRLFRWVSLAGRPRCPVFVGLESNGADTVEKSDLKPLSCREFLKKIFKIAYKTQALIVGFNLPFDLSRLGFDVSTARREFVGGFSLSLWSYSDKAGRKQSDPNRPRITIKHIDSKRSLMSFTGRKEPDQVDLIPEDSIDGRPVKGHKIRGHFLDLKTLAFALSDRAHTLKSACEAFGVERAKTQASEHGKIGASCAISRSHSVSSRL